MSHDVSIAKVAFSYGMVFLVGVMPGATLVMEYVTWRLHR